jgi:hypothetical protein
MRSMNPITAASSMKLISSRQQRAIWKQRSMPPPR